MTTARVAAVGVMTAIVLAVAQGALAASAQPARQVTWRLVRGPAVAPNNVLNSIAAVSTRSAWAGGVQGFTSDGSKPGRPLLEHWNGRAWSVSALPVTWP